MIHTYLQEGKVGPDICPFILKSLQPGSSVGIGTIMGDFF